MAYPIEQYDLAMRSALSLGNNGNTTHVIRQFAEAGDDHRASCGQLVRTTTISVTQKNVYRKLCGSCGRTLSAQGLSWESVWDSACDQAYGWPAHRIVRLAMEEHENGRFLPANILHEIHGITGEYGSLAPARQMATDILIWLYREEARPATARGDLEAHLERFTEIFERSHFRVRIDPAFAAAGEEAVEVARRLITVQHNPYTDPEFRIDAATGDLLVGFKEPLTLEGGASNREIADRTFLYPWLEPIEDLTFRQAPPLPEIAPLHRVASGSSVFFSLGDPRRGLEHVLRPGDRLPILAVQHSCVVHFGHRTTKSLRQSSFRPLCIPDDSQVTSVDHDHAMIQLPIKRVSCPNCRKQLIETGVDPDSAFDLLCALGLDDMRAGVVAAIDDILLTLLPYAPASPHQIHINGMTVEDVLDRAIDHLGDLLPDAVEVLKDLRTRMFPAVTRFTPAAMLSFTRYKENLSQSIVACKSLLGFRDGAFWITDRTQGRDLFTVAQSAVDAARQQALQHPRRPTIKAAAP